GSGGVGLLTAAVGAMAGRAATRPLRVPSAGGAVERARRRLEEAFPGDVGADELAAAAGCSRFALYRGFRRAYGMSPSDYQRQLRLREARRLLARGGRAARSGGEAAAAAGFADQRRLTRWCVRYYGMTPGEYRNATTR